MHVAVTVVSVLDAPRLEGSDRLADVLGDRAALRVRHQATRSEDRAEPSHDGHHGGNGDDNVEVEGLLARLHGLGQVLATDEIGAGFFGLTGLVGFCEDDDLDVFAGSVGEADCSSNDLIRLPGVDAQPECDVDRLVELRE